MKQNEPLANLSHPSVVTVPYLFSAKQVYLPSSLSCRFIRSSRTMVLPPVGAVPYRGNETWWRRVVRRVQGGGW